MAVTDTSTSKTGYAEKTRRGLNAASPQSSGANTCPVCDKAGLPLLLTRPGIVSKADEATSDAQKLLKGATGDVQLPSGKQGYAVRTLRQGYVMVYYQTPTCGRAKVQNGWEAYRVDTKGRLTPATIPQSEHADCPGTKGDDEDFSCDRTPSYASAMMLVIPQPKKAGKVWIAFSDHRWSQPVRDYYAKNPGQRMTEVSIDGNKASCDNSVALSADFVQKHILDYAHDPTQPAKEPSEHLYPIADKRPETPGDLEQQAQRIVSQPDGDGFAMNDAKVVALADPVGLTAEAAYRRVALPQSANEYLIGQGKKDLIKNNGNRHGKDRGDFLQRGHWLLQSANSIQNTLDLIDQRKAKRLQALAPYYDTDGHRTLHSISEYKQLKQEGKLPESARFVMDIHKRPEAFYNWSWEQQQQWLQQDAEGWIQPGTQPREVKADARRLTQAFKDNLHPEWSSFKQEYDNKQTGDQDKLKALDEDYVAWLNSALRKLVTRHDYEPTVPVDGVAYAVAVATMTLHGPQARPSEDKFAELFTTDPNNHENLLMRASLGNCPGFFGWMAQVRKGNGPYDNYKTIFNLDEIDASPVRTVNQADLSAVEPAIKQIIANISATVAVQAKNAAKDKRKDKDKQTGHDDEQNTTAGKNSPQSDPALRYKAMILTGALGITSSDDPPSLVMVRLKLGEAVRLWHRRNGQLAHNDRQTSTHHARTTLSGAIDPAFFLDPDAADKEIEVPAWSHATDSIAASSLVSPLLAAGVAASEAGEDISKLPRKLQETKLAGLVAQSPSAVRSVGSLFALVALTIDSYAIISTLGDLDELEGRAHQSAVLQLGGALSSAVGATIDTIGISKRLVSRGGVTLSAGVEFLGGIASAIMAGCLARQSYLHAVGNLNTSDIDAGYAQIAQSLVFGLAAGAFATSAVLLLPFTADVFIRLTAFVWGLAGIGLLIVAALIGLIVLWFEDSPLATWAAQSIWGKHKDGYGYNSPKSELRELHERLMGVRIDFTDSGMFLHNVAASYAATQMNRSAVYKNSFAPSDSSFQQPEMHSEATLTLSFPLIDKRPWAYNITGHKKDGGSIVLARQGHNVPFKADAPDIASPAHVTSEHNAEDNTVTEHLTYPSTLFEKLVATVQIYQTDDDSQPYRQPFLTEKLQVG